MIIFWTLSAGLAVLAVLFVALPLLRPLSASDAPGQDELNLVVFKERLKELDADLAAGVIEQSRYDSARRDLERDLLINTRGDTPRPSEGRTGGRWLAPVLAVFVPAFAVAVYLELGDHELISHMESAAFGAHGAHGADAGAQDLPPLELLVDRLAERLEQEPGDLEGWLMLARTYFTLDRPGDALEAVSRAYAMGPDRPDVMLAYAGAIAANNGNSLEGKPAELVEQVIAAEPDNASARWLQGMLYFQRGQYAAADSAWQRVLAQMDPASEEAEDMRGMIAEARSRAGAPPSDAGSPAAPVAAPAENAPAGASATDETSAAAGRSATPGGALPLEADPVPDAPRLTSPPTGSDQPVAQEPAMTHSSGRSLSVRVALADSFAAQAHPEQVVFVFARAADGPPMPIAVQRIQVKDLPAVVTLDETMGMTPALSLAAFSNVIVGARVSSSGLAPPQSGDLEGEYGPIDVDTSASLAVTIDRVRP